MQKIKDVLIFGAISGIISLPFIYTSAWKMGIL